MSSVSVIIPARDAEATFACTLDSLLSQHLESWQAIIVNDGSSDGTGGIASSYCGRDKRFKMIETDRVGPAAARNEGLRHAKGDLLLFLDADDWIVPDHLARLTAVLQSAPDAEASYCGYVRVTPEGRAFLPRFDPRIAAQPKQEFVRRNHLAPHAILLRRGPVEDIGGFDPGLRTCEDWDLWQRLSLAGARFAAVNGLHARYRLRPNSLSTNLGQLFRNASTVIGNGLGALPDAGSEHGLILAWFGLWCRAVSAGQSRSSVTELPELPLIPVSAEEADSTVTMLAEALCTGACCTPAHLARNWDECKKRIETILQSAVNPAAHGAIADGFARKLGIDPERPAELVSVVIPAYRATETIVETLQSVQTQTHSRLDIAVVDDGSPDGTPETVLALAANDPRISLVQQTNAGVAAARNRGWRGASSDLIAFVDADDLWAPGKIERQLAALKAEGGNAGLAYTWYARIDDKSVVTSRSHKPDAEGDVLGAIFLGNFVGNGSAALITRAALEHAGGFDATLHARGAQGCEDFSIYFRIAEKYRFALVPEPLTGYRVLPGNMSSDGLRMLRSFDLVVAEMLERHPERRREVMTGRTLFLEWSLLWAAERGDFRTWFRLHRIHFRQNALSGLGALFLKVPRAVIRGMRLHIVGRPRRRRDYAPVRFPIGSFEGSHG